MDGLNFVLACFALFAENRGEAPGFRSSCGRSSTEALEGLVPGFLAVSDGFAKNVTHGSLPLRANGNEVRFQRLSERIMACETGDLIELNGRDYAFALARALSAEGSVSSTCTVC